MTGKVSVPFQSKAEASIGTQGLGGGGGGFDRRKLYGMTEETQEIKSSPSAYPGLPTTTPAQSPFTEQRQYRG